VINRGRQRCHDRNTPQSRSSTNYGTLKKLVADLALDNAILRDAVEGSF
jgi:hypothetical protein